MEAGHGHGNHTCRAVIMTYGRSQVPISENV
jgi:hypothetical protein